MRLPTVVIAACVLFLAPTPRSIAADQPPLDPASLYRQSALDGADLAFAYDRMNGITPDFRLYAEQSMTYRAATAFDREAVLAREIARYQAYFRSFDPAKVYDVRLSTELQQYTAARGGYALGLGEDAFVPMRDPATARDYGLQFRNVGDVNFIPVGDPAAGRAFAQQNGLNMQGVFAGIVTLQLAFRLVEAPPALDNGGPLMVRADILAARVLSTGGVVIHDFGLTPAASRAPSAPGTESAGQAMLKAADIQGLHLGMPQSEAEAIAAKGRTAKRGSQQAGQVLWFNGLQARQGDWAACGNLTNGFPSMMELEVGASPPPYTDCIGYGFARDGASNGPFSDRVGRVVAQQAIAGGDPTAVRQALEGKYGKPTYVRSGGGDLVWVGRDPARPESESVRIEAVIGADAGQDAQHAVVLQLSLVPYVDPQRPLPATATPGSGGPKL